MKTIKNAPNFASKLSEQLPKFKQSSTIAIGHQQIRKLFGQYSLQQIWNQFCCKMDGLDRPSDRQKKQHSKIYISLIDAYGEQILYQQFYERIMQSLSKKSLAVSQVVGHLCKTLLSRIHPAENAFEYVSYLLVVFRNHIEIPKVIKNIVQNVDSIITAHLQHEIITIISEKLNGKNKLQPIQALLALVLAIQDKFQYESVLQNIILKNYKNEDYNIRKTCVDICYGLMAIKEEANQTLHRVVKQLKYDKIKHVRQAVSNYNVYYKQIYGEEEEVRKSINSGSYIQQHQPKIIVQLQRQLPNNVSMKKKRNQDFFQNAKESDVIKTSEDNNKSNIIVRRKTDGNVNKNYYHQPQQQEEEEEDQYIKSLRQSVYEPQQRQDQYQEQSDHINVHPNFKDYLRKREPQSYTNQSQIKVSYADRLLKKKQFLEVNNHKSTTKLHQERQRQREIDKQRQRQLKQIQQRQRQQRERQQRERQQKQRQQKQIQKRQRQQRQRQQRQRQRQKEIEIEKEKMRQKQREREKQIERQRQIQKQKERMLIHPSYQRNSLNIEQTSKKPINLPNKVKKKADLLNQNFKEQFKQDNRISISDVNIRKGPINIRSSKGSQRQIKGESQNLMILTETIQHFQKMIEDRLEGIDRKMNQLQQKFNKIQEKIEICLSSKGQAEQHFKENNYIKQSRVGVLKYELEKDSHQFGKISESEIQINHDHSDHEDQVLTQKLQQIPQFNNPGQQESNNQHNLVNDGVQSQLEAKVRQAANQQNWDEAYSLVMANGSPHLLLQVLETLAIPSDSIVLECLLMEVKKMIDRTPALKWFRNFLNEMSVDKKTLNKFRIQIQKIGKQQQKDRNLIMLKNIVLQEMSQLGE